MKGHVLWMDKAKEIIYYRLCCLANDLDSRIFEARGNIWVNKDSIRSSCFRFAVDTVFVSFTGNINPRP